MKRSTITTIALMVVWLLLMVCHIGAVTFEPQITYPTGAGPMRLESADLNNDGLSDIAVVNLEGSSFSVFLNSGNGLFSAAENYPALTRPRSICAADLNNDEFRDLAIACDPYSSNIMVYFNQGDGTFILDSIYTASMAPSFVTANDIDSDSDCDIIVSNEGIGNSGSISVLKNNGNGTFDPAVNYPAGDNPWKHCVSYLNTDEYLDIAVVNIDGDDVSILINNGDGTFASAVHYPANDAPTSISCADVNGDNNKDLIVTNILIDSISILINNGGGLFAAPISFGTGDRPISTEPVDLDLDGDVDLAVGYDAGDSISILLNFGNGTFTEPVNIAVGSHPREITAADFDGDGDPDLGVANFNSNSISILLNNTLQPVNSVYTDIKPGSCPNPLNVNPYRDYYYDTEAVDNTGFASVVPEISRKPNAKFPTAILGTKDFDVSQIDPSTIVLEGVPPLRWDYEDVSTPVGPDAEECECTSLGPDGYADLTLKFDRGAIIAALGNVYDGEVIPLTISGQLYDGTEFEGVDCVIIKGTIEEYGGDYAEFSDTQDMGLIGNSPNPFNPETEISYGLAQGCYVRLDIFNINGQKVVTLVDQYQDAGVHSVTWDSRGADGKPVASGIYLYRLTAGEYVDTKKMILMK